VRHRCHLTAPHTSMATGRRWHHRDCRSRPPLAVIRFCANTVGGARPVRRCAKCALAAGQFLVVNLFAEQRNPRPPAPGWSRQGNFRQVLQNIFPERRGPHLVVHRDSKSRSTLCLLTSTSTQRFSKARKTACWPDEQPALHPLSRGCARGMWLSLEREHSEHAAVADYPLASDEISVPKLPYSGVRIADTSPLLTGRPIGRGQRRESAGSSPRRPRTRRQRP
jgi:hypothetical protein